MGNVGKKLPASLKSVQKKLYFLLQSKMSKTWYKYQKAKAFMDGFVKVYNKSYV